MGGALSCPRLLLGTETMSVDSSLPSPNQLSSPNLGFDGLPGRRRKKRTSIETNVRFALEKSFLAVSPPFAAPPPGSEDGRGKGAGLTSLVPAEPEAYLRGDPADRRAAAHGEGSDPRLVLQPAPEGEAHDAAGDPTADAGRRVLAGGRRERRHAAAAPRAADECAVTARTTATQRPPPPQPLSPPPLSPSPSPRRPRTRATPGPPAALPSTQRQVCLPLEEKKRDGPKRHFFEVQGRRGKTNK